MSSARAAAETKRKSVDSGTKKKRLYFKGIPVFTEGGFDIIYLILVFLLLTIGLIMMFSASYVSAKYGGNSTGNDPFYYIKKQLVFAVFGIIMMFILSKINPGIFKLFTPAISVFSGILLILVLIVPAEIPGKEEFKRWLVIPLIKTTFQPSDVAKLALILGLAYLVEKYKKEIEKKWWVALLFFGLVGAVCGLVYLEHHLSGTILMGLIGIGMLYLGGLDGRWFAIGIVVAIAGILFILTFKDKILNPYQAERIDSFIHKDYDDVDTRWQTNQSLFALGSGGFFGLGLGNSIQKHLYMPEPQNDFIFAIVGEELGFFRCVIILMIFAALVFRGFIIATRTKTLFERLVVLGISLQIGLQTVFNILVVTDMVPNTGISLPFFSYGGTALVVQLVEMGIVLSVSRSGNRVRAGKK
ncbi:MAG: FtsW/RodA/SpoVE family cell cycle protein [Ruminococcus sp.]|nr:FtsW/RodA/SpoVE family cell cycle protein [Candidatus Copronaster equi]